MYFGNPAAVQTDHPFFKNDNTIKDLVEVPQTE